jgi:saccharopepsin
MVPSKALLSLILVTLTAVDAYPASRRTDKPTLRFSTKISQRGTLNIVEQDRARAQTMKQAGQLGKRSTPQSFSAANAGLVYFAEVGVGSPPTNCMWITRDCRCGRAS